MDLIILDRDGVINQDSDAYIKSVDEWIAIPGSIDAIARLCGAGFRIAVATNQAGLARELFAQEDLDSMHEKMCRLVEDAGGRIDYIAYCPHHPNQNCACRKPRTGLLESIQAHFGEPVNDAWFVGDSLKDIQAAIGFHCRPALVMTGKGPLTQSQLADGALGQTDNIPVFPNLAAFTDSILSNSDISHV